MMHDAAQEHAVEARIGKRQLLNISFDEFKLRMLAATERFMETDEWRLQSARINKLFSSAE